MSADDVQDVDFEAVDADLEADADADADDDDVDADEPGTLSPRERLFVYGYGDTESRVFGQRTAAARAAGYSGPRSAGLKLVRRPRVKEALDRLHKTAAASAGRVLANLQSILQLAVEKGDLRVAARCAELQGKHLGLFLDVHIVDEPAQRQLSALEEREALRLSRLMLLGADESPVIAGALAQLSQTHEPAQGE